MSFGGGFREDPWKRQLAALGAVIRSQRAATGLSLRELARRTEVSNAYLSQVERGLHEPSIRVLRAVARALDLPFNLLLAQAGMLEDVSRPADEEVKRIEAGMDTEAAIEADPRLTEEQRFALLAIYRSFVGTARSV